jgi:hypothetical protein
MADSDLDVRLVGLERSIEEVKTKMMGSAWPSLREEWSLA